MAANIWRRTAHLALTGLALLAGSVADARGSSLERDKVAVQASFDRWKAGTGSPFELLAPEARWTIIGSSALARTYSRQQFLDQVITPFNARLATRLIPSVRGIYADQDMVIILFDASATARDGLPYRNSYTWYFRMAGGRIVEAIAFFDNRDFDEFWARVTPAAADGSPSAGDPK